MQQRKERLEQLRTHLNIKLKAKDFLEKELSPFTEIFNFLNQSKVTYTLVDLLGYQQEWAPYFQEELKKPPYDQLNDDISKLKTQDLLSRLFDLYPSVNELRYVPSVDKVIITASTPGAGLKKAVDTLSLENQLVYVYYLRYAPLLKIQLHDLVQLGHEELFNFWFGDVVIFPQTHSWLIAFSLEEEWYAGRLN